jgi:hypothetical protein
MRRCRCSDDMEPDSCTNSMKREIHAPKRYDVIHALGCIAIVAPGSHL